MLTRNFLQNFVTLCCVSALLLFAGATPGRADTFHIEQGLTGLRETARLEQFDGTFYFQFQLTDGSQLGNGTTQVRITNFQLIGGTLGEPLEPLGAATGTLSSLVHLTDTDPSFAGLADYAQAFQIPVLSTAPIAISYDITLNATGYDSPMPDALFMRILTPNLTPVPTFSSTGEDFLTAEFQAPYSLHVGPETYGGPGYFLFGQTFGGFTAGTVTRITSAAAPEPGTLTLLFPSLVILLAASRIRPNLSPSTQQG